MLSETAFTIPQKKMVEKDLEWLIIASMSAHASRCAVRQHGDRDLRRMRIVPFALGLVVAMMTVGGSGAKTTTMDLKARPPTKPVLLVSLATDSAVRSESTVSRAVLPPEGGGVLGAGMLAAESTGVDGSQAETTPNAHIPTAVVLLSCALVALATLGRRRKTHKS